DPGFIRVSRGDPYCFEYETGGFFYPIGHNVHSPIDLRCAKVLGLSPPPPDLGTFLYDDIFAKMEAAGENTVEIWMSSWWLGIEWTSRWKGYQGPGRYNLDNAWKLDYALALARKHGLKVHLVIDNHGKMSNWCDPEWKDSPHNQYSDYNGSVRNVRDFFTDPTARELHKRRLRYIIARWAGDPTIMGFELVSEYDLIADNRHFYRTPTAQAWLREMMTFFRENDPYGHPLTNHYATDCRYIDMEMARTPLFDYVTGDGYRPAGAFYPLAVDTSRYLAPLRKPFLITEFGGNWDGTTESRLEADLHTGLWASFMTLAGGTPLFWWYDFIDRRDLYFHYKAFAGFVSGEDRRGQDFAPFEGAVPSGGRLQYLGIRGRDVTYLWLFDPAAMEDMPPPDSRPHFPRASIAVPGLPPSRYEVEFWDTYKGGRIASEIVDATSGILSCSAPPFRNDIAVKIRRYDADRPPARGLRPAPESGPAPASGPSHAPTGSGSGDGTGR
ncbi:MAG: hypothetical protein N3A38_02645, partial [Planctomycetota bacterium]|nr:hypothetical protein [Planctomycetota bacterium]